MIDNKNILKEELEQLQKDVIANQQYYNAWASGETAKGYTVKVENSFHGKLEGYAYVGVLETGRKPGKVPYHFNEIIKRWIIAKGLNHKDEKDLNRMANAIAWTIRKEGTTLHRNGYKIDIFETPIKEFSERLSGRLSTLYRQETANQIHNL
jgi:hypothetical protein